VEKEREEKFLGFRLPLIRFRSRRTFNIFKISVASVFIIIILLLFNANPSNRVFSYFSRKCINYKQKDFSRKLNDRLVDYASAAKQRGIVPCKNDEDIRARVAAGKLVKIKGGRIYTIDRLTHSSPYLTRDTKKLLDEIARRFREKTTDKKLYGAKLIVTSMTRKTESIKRLRKYNSNASENSPHQYGNALDITYKRFIVKKMTITHCDHKFMKEALAEIILELKKEGKCWATYERSQNCFHVVSR
jgi:uncharacterized protein YcbK (DUF882 family)